MSELQLGLLAIGVVLVVGVFAYNRRQESVARRAAESSLRSGHADVLLEEAEPVRSVAAAAEKPAHTAPSRASPTHGAALPDPKVDYVIDLAFATPVTPGTLLQQWKANEHRYASGVILAGSAGGEWRRLSADDSATIESLRAGLQLVTREGAVSDAELIEFRAAVETLAAATGATVSAPEIRPAAEAARALDEFCSDSDIQVVVHVVAASGATLSGTRIRSRAEASGLVAEEGGRLALRDATGQLLYTLGPLEVPEPAAVSLTLDVPRVPDFPRAFQSMARFANQLAAELGGNVVDDNSNPLDERSIRAIGAQLDSVRSGFDAKGIAAGSASALRLFS
jgi:FtsZ-interacting cell division protein ZipA